MSREGFITVNNSGGKEKSFNFDHVFGSDSSQQQIYDSTLKGLVQSNIFKGFNVTILAYSQTGSGKTFTMGTSGNGTVNGELESKKKMNCDSLSMDNFLPLI